MTRTFQKLNSCLFLMRLENCKRNLTLYAKMAMSDSQLVLLNFGLIKYGLDISILIFEN